MTGTLNWRFLTQMGSGGHFYENILKLEFSKKLRKPNIFFHSQNKNNCENSKVLRKLLCNIVLVN